MFPFDQNNQLQYQQDAQASDSGDFSQIDPNQAAGHVQQFAQNAPVLAAWFIQAGSSSLNATHALIDSVLLHGISADFV